MNFLNKLIPPQSIRVFNTIKKSPKTAKEIGRLLNVLPNAVYRAVKPLQDLGLVEERGYPVKFIAKPETSAIEIYSQAMKQNFFEIFGELSQSPALNLQINFIHTRKEMLELYNKDIVLAKKFCNIIISGHEIPAQTMLANKQAMDKGVPIRILVQTLDYPEMLNNWKRIGHEIRYYPKVNARIVTIDENIVYFASYDPKDNKKAIGVRFVYPPYARLMDELFEQRWTKAKII